MNEKWAFLKKYLKYFKLQLPSERNECLLRTSDEYIASHQGSSSFYPEMTNSTAHLLCHV